MLGFTKVSHSLVGQILITVAIGPVRLEVGNGLEPRLFESAGIKQTSSARERNMLNILSYNCSTLRTSRVVIDKSQSTKPLVWFKFTEFDWLQICEFDLSFWIWLIAVLICDRFKFLNLIDCSVWVWLKFLNLIDCGVWFVSLIWLQCLICEFDLIAAFDLWVFLNLIVTGIARAPCSRCQFREDGSVPTLATRSSTYSMSLGRDLELPELATLMLGVLKLIVSNHSIFCDLWWGSVQCLSFSTHFVCEKRLGLIWDPCHAKDGIAPVCRFHRANRASCAEDDRKWDACGMRWTSGWHWSLGEKWLDLSPCLIFGSMQNGANWASKFGPLQRET